jgi:aspartate carbamoyltransferase catalytic subunit
VDLISIDSLSDADIDGLVLRALTHFDEVRAGAVADPLAGRILFNLFYENSTRTLMSFATAAHRLGMAVVTLPVEQSSAKKGESLADTARTLNAMRPSALVIRHQQDGAADDVAAIMDAPVINAGDGTGEHPTQALLDAATLVRHFGSLDGKTVAICGDIRHSRVARSNARLLPRLGATVRLAGPAKLMPEDAASMSIDEAIAGTDAVMMLRVQRERLEEELGDAPGEYLRLYGLTPERLATAARDAVVLHPGPMNRGVEIADSVADDRDRSLITTQVEMGVAMRMACLELVVGRAEA